MANAAARTYICGCRPSCHSPLSTGSSGRVAPQARFAVHCRAMCANRELDSARIPTGCCSCWLCPASSGSVTSVRTWRPLKCALHVCVHCALAILSLPSTCAGPVCHSPLCVTLWAWCDIVCEALGPCVVCLLLSIFTLCALQLGSHCRRDQPGYLQTIRYCRTVSVGTNAPCVHYALQSVAPHAGMWNSEVEVDSAQSGPGLSQDQCAHAHVVLQSLFLAVDWLLRAPGS